MITKKRDSWTYFWAEYMVWSSRILCYCVNAFFFGAFKGALPKDGLDLFLYDIAAFFYSIIILYFIELFLKKVHNPSYQDLNLTEEEQHHRTLSERIIFSCIIYCVLNFMLAMLMIFLVGKVDKLFILTGIMGGSAAFLCNFFGIVLLVIRDNKTGELLGGYCVIGGLFLLVPISYLVYALYLYGKSL